eukprot:6490838-Amphidinium_carterae.1
MHSSIFSQLSWSCVSHQVLQIHVKRHVHTDSARGKAMIQKLGSSKKSQHVQLKYLHLQEPVEQGVITRHKVSSLLNPSDILTKLSPQVTMTKHFVMVKVALTTLVAFIECRLQSLHQGVTGRVIVMINLFAASAQSEVTMPSNVKIQCAVTLQSLDQDDIGVVISTKCGAFSCER